MMNNDYPNPQMLNNPDYSGDKSPNLNYEAYVNNTNENRTLNLNGEVSFDNI